MKVFQSALGPASRVIRVSNPPGERRLVSYNAAIKYDEAQATILKGAKNHFVAFNFVIQNDLRRL